MRDRKIQIQYLKNTSPKLAKIPWQVYDLDLYNYKYFNSLYMPRRVYRFLSRVINSKALKKPSIIQRNWELQFLGKKNSKHLEYWLFEKKPLNDIIPVDLIKQFYHNFQNENQVTFSHPISMLLTLSVWCDKFWKKKLSLAVYSGTIPAPIFVENFINLIADKNKYLFIWKWKIC